MSHQRAKNIARGGEGVHPNQISGSHRLFNVIAQSISCTLNRTAQHAHEWNRKMCHKMRIKSSSLKIIKLLGNSNIYFVTVNLKKKYVQQNFKTKFLSAGVYILVHTVL